MRVFKFRLAPVGMSLSDGNQASFLGPLDAGAESVWIETFERRLTADLRLYIERAKQEMRSRNPAVFPSAGPNEARTVFIRSDGLFLIDAVALS
jgi:hypothetical protein